MLRSRTASAERVKDFKTLNKIGGLPAFASTSRLPSLYSRLVISSSLWQVKLRVRIPFNKGNRRQYQQWSFCTAANSAHCLSQPVHCLLALGVCFVVVVVLFVFCYIFSLCPIHCLLALGVFFSSSFLGLYLLSVSCSLSSTVLVLSVWGVFVFVLFSLYVLFIVF